MRSPAPFPPPTPGERRWPRPKLEKAGDIIEGISMDASI